MQFRSRRSGVIIYSNFGSANNHTLLYWVYSFDGHDVHEYRARTFEPCFHENESGNTVGRKHLIVSFHAVETSADSCYSPKYFDRDIPTACRAILLTYEWRVCNAYLILFGFRPYAVVQ